MRWTRGVKALNIESGKEDLSLLGLTGDVRSIAVSNDGKRLFAGSAYNLLTPGNADDTIKAWDRETHKEILTLRGHSGAVLSLIPTRDGKRLVSSSGDGTIKVWDLATSKELLTLPGHIFGVAGLVLSRDGKRLVSVGRDGTVKIWDMDGK
jgi:WD40 repeat protein